uniref:Immunoglobulin V-set domain-containing protein n=1 Tax=Cyprinus carpio TaxID=7962 RepID=A0A8C1TCX6_CYPCA
MEKHLLLILILTSGMTFLFIREEETVTLSCTYDTSSNYAYLYWYRQYPNEELRYLLFKPARSDTSNPLPDRLIPKVDKNKNLVSLEISDAEVTDSALYYYCVFISLENRLTFLFYFRM